MADVVEAVDQARPAPEGSDPIYSRIQDNVRDTFVGAAAGLRVGFQTGVQASELATEKVGQGMVAASHEVADRFEKIPQVVKGVKEGLQ